MFWHKKKLLVVFPDNSYSQLSGGIREVTVWPTGVMTWLGKDGEQRELHPADEGIKWKWLVRPDKPLEVG